VMWGGSTPGIGDTPVFFSREEAQQIGEMLRTPEASVECPCCGGEVVLRGPITSVDKEATIFQVSCKPCCRTAIIIGVPGTRRPDTRG